MEPSSHISIEVSKIAFRALFFYPFDRATLVGVACMDDARSSHSISICDEIGTLNINAQASTPISCPPNYKLAVSRPKRGGVEENLGWSYLLSLTGVISTSATRTLMFHTPLIPLHQTFHYLSSQDAPENV